jgi:hypothetical protein
MLEERARVRETSGMVVGKRKRTRVLKSKSLIKCTVCMSVG